VFKFFFSSVKEASKSYASPFCLKLPRISAGVLKQKKGKILWPIKKTLTDANLIAPHSLLKLKASYSVQEGELNAEIKLKKKFPSLHNLFPPFFFRKKAGKKKGGGRNFLKRKRFIPFHFTIITPKKRGLFFIPLGIYKPFLYQQKREVLFSLFDFGPSPLKAGKTLAIAFLFNNFKFF
jgi:hypothetical protein